MIRHVVNFGLLFAFLGLAVTGVMAFILPFSITTTRVHIVFGGLTLLLVILHLVSRTRYFKSKLHGQNSSLGMVISVAIIIGGIASLAIAGLWPTNAAIDLGYEARHKAQIVRSSPYSGFLDDGKTQWIVRKSNDPDAPSIALAMRFHDDLPSRPAVAVWVESTTGSMVETLYLDEALTYSEQVEWQGLHTERHKLLPLWRHKYTLLSGVEPSGEIDLYSAPTQSHSFEIEKHLKGGNEFILCVEINAVRDPNETYPDPDLGQPSLLYTAYFKPGDGDLYGLLELTAHGGDASKGGTASYDLDGITTAKKFVDLLLAKIGTDVD